MELSMLRNRHRAVEFVLFWLICICSAMAQESKQQWESKPQANLFNRIFYNDYTAPSVRDFYTGKENALEAVIRDGKLILSAEDAVRLALENNVDINVERYGPYFSFWGIEKGKSVLDPTVQFSSTVNRNVTPTSSVLQGGDTLLNLNIPYNINVHKPFESGLDLDVNFSTVRARTSSSFTNLNPSFTSVVGFTLTQHLLKDFGKVSRGRYLRVARNNYNISQATFVQRVTDIITNVLNIYWDVAWADEDIKVKEASRKLAEVILDQNKIQAEVGTMSPLDVVQAEAEVAARTEQVVTARYTKRLAEDLLKKLIAPQPDPMSVTASIETASKPEPPPAPRTDVLAAIKRACDKRPEIMQQQLDQENKKIQIEYTKNQLRPTLDLVASYSQNGLGGDRILRDYTNGFFNAPIIGMEPGGFGDSLHSMFTYRYLSYIFGATLRIPIGNKDARASYAQAQIDYRQGEERTRSLRQRIALDVRQAYEFMEMSGARLDTAQTTVRYQERRLQGEQDKYALGATITRFILEAQRDLQDAQSRALRAKIDLIKSQIMLDKAVGETLAAYNIELKDALPGLR